MITGRTSFPVILKLSGKLGGLVRHLNPLIFAPECFFSSLLCFGDFLNFLLHQENILIAFFCNYRFSCENCPRKGNNLAILSHFEIVINLCAANIGGRRTLSSSLLCAPMKYCH